MLHGTWMTIAVVIRNINGHYRYVIRNMNGHYRCHTEHEWPLPLCYTEHEWPLPLCYTKHEWPLPLCYTEHEWPLPLLYGTWMAITVMLEGTWMAITVFTETCQWSLFRTERIQHTNARSVPLRFISLLFSCLSSKWSVPFKLVIHPFRSVWSSVTVSQLILQSFQLAISTACSYDVSSFYGTEDQTVVSNGKALISFIWIVNTYTPAWSLEEEYIYIVEW
jgi:hypothetical protein